MRGVSWFIIIGAVIGIAWYLHRLWRQFAERQEAAESRMMNLVAEARPATAPVLPPIAPASAPPAGAAMPAQAPQERLLLDAAAKAGEAGEPALSIQLYAKLLSRYPQTAYASQARTAVEAQKKKLARH
jgi:hypothetical protein